MPNIINEPIGGGASASIQVPTGSDSFDVPRDLQKMARDTLAAIRAKPDNDGSTAASNALNTARHEAVLLDPRIVGKTEQLVLYPLRVFGDIGAVDIAGNRFRMTGAGTSNNVPNARITADGWIQITSHNNSAARFKEQIHAVDEPKYEILNLTPVTYRFKAVPAPAKPSEADLQARFPDADPAEIRMLRDEMTVEATPAGPTRYGFIADQVQGEFPIAAENGEDGVLETIDERALIAGLLSVVKDMHARIVELETAASIEPPDVPDAVGSYEVPA